MKKHFIFFILTALIVLSVITPVAASAETYAVQYYVAVNGDDGNIGSMDSPFATLQRAHDAARTAGGAQVYINIRGGEYILPDTLSFDNNDTNTVYRAYKNEAVSVSGVTNVIPSSTFSKVTDNSVLKRIVNSSARDKIYAADLTKLGIEDYGKIACIGRGGYYADSGDGTINSPILYFNDSEQTLARYPNDGYIKTAKILNYGATNGNTSSGYIFITNSSRLANWGNATEPWIFGYLNSQYIGGYMPVTVSAIAGEIWTDKQYGNGVSEGNDFYAFNLLEELDVAGEWYLERTNGMLYIIPPSDITQAKIEFANSNKPLVSMNGSVNIQFKNIKFTKNNNVGIDASNCGGLVFDGCEFTNISGNCVTIKYSTDSGVKNSNIHDVGSSGISFENCGNRTDLTPSGCFVENNTITRYSKILSTDFQAVKISNCVGVSVRHNVISDAPQQAISYTGNDNIIEYNEIYNVCKKTNSNGAIFTVMHWEGRGNVIRYNYFHDIKDLAPYMVTINSGAGGQEKKIKSVDINSIVGCVYLSIYASGNEVSNNVFSKVDSAAVFRSGQDNKFCDNIVLDAEFPIQFECSTYPTGEPMSFLNEVPYQTGIWAERYPTLVDILKKSPELPLYNVVKDNFINSQSATFDYTNSANLYIKPENTVTKGSSSSFADYSKRDFTVKPDSDLAKALPNLLDIKFKDIGTYKVDNVWEDIPENNDRSKDVAANSIVLLLDSPNAVAFGNAVTLDAPPVTVNDRTVVPVRFIAENFGAEVIWNENEQSVTINYNGKKIVLIIDSNEMKVDDTTVALDAPAQTMNDRTVVPFRAIAENLGKKVFWDDSGLIVMSDGNIISSGDTDTINGLVAMLKNN